MFLPFGNRFCDLNERNMPSFRAGDKPEDTEIGAYGWMRLGTATNHTVRQTRYLTNSFVKTPS